MLADIIRELMKTNENTQVTSEQVLVQAKKEAQRAQATVTNSLSEVKDFDEIHARKSDQNGIISHTAVKMPMGKCK